jgi:hypothetical protein
MVTRHEIEIPDGADKFHHEMTDRDGYVSRGWVPIPRPKKVKKCQYVTFNTDHCGRKRAEVTGWLTELEAMARALEPEDRIYQTEIEVEE